MKKLVFQTLWLPFQNTPLYLYKIDTFIDIFCALNIINRVIDGLMSLILLDILLSVDKRIFNDGIDFTSLIILTHPM